MFSRILRTQMIFKLVLSMHTFLFVTLECLINHCISDMKTLKLESSDAEIITVETDVIKQSGTIEGMLQDLEEQDQSDTPIPVQNVSGNILHKVIEWCKHHKNDPPMKDDSIFFKKILVFILKIYRLEKFWYDENDRKTDIPTWDAEFLKVDQVS